MSPAEFLRLLLSLSCSGTILAAGVWLCRKLFGQQLSCAARYYLWILVLLRLVLPIGLPGSVMESTATRLDAALTQYVSANERPDAGLQSEGLGQQTESTAAGRLPTVPAGDETAAGTNGQPLTESDRQNAANTQQTRSPAALLPAALASIWTMGFFLCFARDVLAYRRLRSALKTESVPVDPEDLALFRQQYGQAGGLLRVRLACSTATRTPMLLGLLKPVLVLPARSYCRQGQAETLQFLLRHEMTHYRRGDLWYKWFLLSVRAVHWFNPIMPLLLRAVEQDCEQACDEAVIKELSPTLRRSYGSMLLAYAGTTHLSAGAAATTLAGSGKEQLRRRLQGILNPHRSSVFTALLTALLVLALTSCGAVLGVTAHPHNQPLPPAAAAQNAQDAVSTQTGAEVQPASDAPIPDSDEALVPVRDYIGNLYVELKYATADNMTGMPLYDYTEPLLRYGTVKKLVKAQIYLNELGYSLKIWDAYRPMAAQQALWQAFPAPAYVSDPATGYLGHTRGNTVDVTLVTLEGKELAMPSGFDQFDARADRDYSDVSPEAAKHATILQQAMEQAGFTGYTAEWSHYSDSVEYEIIRERLTAQQAYNALLTGDRSVLAADDVQRWWIPAFAADGLTYEYGYLDLDGDGVEELLVQMVDSPEGYNGVFHYEDGRLRCWNSDAAEGNCRDHPLLDGTVMRQYELGGSCSYILYRYRSDGTLQETGRLFARESLMEGEDPSPCPYYEVNGTEVTRAEFEQQLAALVTDRLQKRSFWQPL